MVGNARRRWRNPDCVPRRSGRPVQSRQRVAVLIVLLVSIFMAIVTHGAVAATTYDLRGSWTVGPDPSVQGGTPATPQTWHITTMDLSSGSFTGNGSGGGHTWSLSGTASRNSVDLTRTDTDGSGYVAHVLGTISADGNSMHGTFTSNTGQTDGNWSATRVAAASTVPNLIGAYTETDVCNSCGGSTYDWEWQITTEDPSTASFSGTSTGGGSGTLTGTVSGTSIRMTDARTDGYTWYPVGTLAWTAVFGLVDRQSRSVRHLESHIAVRAVWRAWWRWVEGGLAADGFGSRGLADCRVPLAQRRQLWAGDSQTRTAQRCRATSARPSTGVMGLRPQAVGSRHHVSGQVASSWLAASIFI